MIRARATFTAMLIVTVFAVGCDFVSSPEAQAVVDSTREAVQSIDKEKAQPGPDSFNIVFNSFEELRRLAPANR